MAKNDFSIKDVYELLDSRTGEIVNRFDKLEVRVGVIEIWKANLMGKFSIITAVIVVAMGFVIDWTKRQLRIL